MPTVEITSPGSGVGVEVGLIPGSLPALIINISRCFLRHSESGVPVRVGAVYPPVSQVHSLHRGADQTHPWAGSLGPEEPPGEPIP